jgi:4'-phosphopantetheinyl transferase
MTNVIRAELIAMQVFWLEQNVAEVRADTDWLSSDELARFDSFRIPKRRLDWRLGRWTAKHAVAAYLNLPCDPPTLAAIEIRPAASGAPEVFLEGRAAPVSISLTHRDGRAVCAIGDATTVLGCDLEIVEPRSDAFVSDYFTPQEQELVARAAQADRFLILSLLWSAKESTLKALKEGLRIDTRQVEVASENVIAAINTAAESPSSIDAWYPLQTRFEQRTFQGWWRRGGEFVLTLVSEPESAPPARLPQSPHHGA